MEQKKLQTKDFISIGIFSLIYSVVAFVVGGIAQMTPLTFPLMPACIALFTGTVFMLYVAKIPKRGALTCLGVIGGILLFITGMFWMMSLFFVLFGIAADCICASGHFQSFKKNLTAYCIMALAPFGAYVPMALLPAQFDAFMKKKGNTAAFEQIIHTIGTSVWVLPAMTAITLLCAILGGLIGKRILRKHFEKAGIVELYETRSENKIVDFGDYRHNGIFERQSVH